mgnify:CR=1 FL=1
MTTPADTEAELAFARAQARDLRRQLDEERTAHADALRALRRLVERIDHNGGIGEYRGGPAFVIMEARRALATQKEKP